MGFEGKPVGFLCTVAPYYEPGHRRSEREKGKQIQCTWPKTGLYFGKLTYAPEAYVEAAKNKDMPRKFGFGSNKPLDFDDLGSTIEVGRYRHHLALESKTEAKRSPSPPRKRPDHAGGDSLRQSARPPQPPVLGGLQATIPKFTSNFDRQRHVQARRTRGGVRACARVCAQERAARTRMPPLPARRVTRCAPGLVLRCAYRRPASPSRRAPLPQPFFFARSFARSCALSRSPSLSRAQEFSTRRLPADKKFERVNVSLRPESANYGEGCGDKALLKTPTFGVGDFVGSMLSKVHPYVSGTKITVGY